MIIYRTYLDEPFDINKFKNIKNGWGNKPRYGLWGCTGTQWKIWRDCEDFRRCTKYFKWKLKEGSKVYTIDKPEDMQYLWDNYPLKYELLSSTCLSIDFEKLWKDGYDAVELTENGLYSCRWAENNGLYSCRWMENNVMGTASWDVPSICVFNKDIIQLL